MNTVFLKVSSLSLVVLGTCLLASPAHAGCSRGEVEADLRDKYNGLIVTSPGQYNALQLLPIGLETALTGGVITQEWARSELSSAGIDAATFLINNNFDPFRDELIGDIMTFQCWPDWPGRIASGPNIFVPYIAIRRQQQSASGSELVNNQSGMCLDVAQNMPGGNVVIDVCEDSSIRPYQVWSPQGNTLYNHASGMCLDVAQNMPGGNVQGNRSYFV